MLTMLSHDLVLRRNHRIDLESDSPTPFALTTHGSHHIRLIDHASRIWNALLREASHPKYAQLFAGLQEAPVFHSVNSGEVFGIVQSQFAVGYQYMVDIKREDLDDLLDLSAQPEDSARRILASINIDPALLLQPLPTPASTIDGSASMFPSARYGTQADDLHIATKGQASAGPEPADISVSHASADCESSKSLVCSFLCPSHFVY